ncbi:competence protein ComF [Jeotgalibacillus campisalis]|uniref:Competence protein ComF n=2 Tax=Jeotgalibacillus campisalis TaxID=220754 RepID=A0A0C2RML0_9BACL|nr:competence protein ComF [Jeotgalibacillus campisalis]
MGKASYCNPIVKWSGPEEDLLDPPQQPILQWEGTLSIPQQKASDQLVRAVEEKRSTLVHAVCGAGKTELLFQAAAKALEKGQLVCIATPRRDVVQELFPRFQQTFPTIPIQALFGGSEHKNDVALLTIATTHQLYRFQQAFDVMVIDEVDAFPYHSDVTLQNAAQNARKSSSTLIYLTATPSISLLQDVKKGILESIVIPARYHGYPLPVPETRWLGNWKKSIGKKQLPYSLRYWIESRLAIKKRMMLFMPDIPMMLEVEALLRTYTDKIESVHAKDDKRSSKIDRMRRKELDILLTTTILERGVTFSNIDVAVLGAEQSIFTESALVQIAGRAGRDFRFPFGTVAFFHFGHTEAIVQAQKHILRMNYRAKKDGLLKEKKHEPVPELS